MLSRSWRKWAISDFSFSVRGFGLGIRKAWGCVRGSLQGGIEVLSTGNRGVGLGLSRSSSGSQGRSTPPIL